MILIADLLFESAVQFAFSLSSTMKNNQAGSQRCVRAHLNIVYPFGAVQVSAFESL